MGKLQDTQNNWRHSQSTCKLVRFCNKISCYKFLFGQTGQTFAFFYFCNQIPPAKQHIIIYLFNLPRKFCEVLNFLTKTKDKRMNLILRLLTAVSSLP